MKARAKLFVFSLRKYMQAAKDTATCIYNNNNNNNNNKNSFIQYKEWRKASNTSMEMCKLTKIELDYLSPFYFV